MDITKFYGNVVVFLLIPDSARLSKRILKFLISNGSISYYCFDGSNLYDVPSEANVKLIRESVFFQDLKMLNQSMQLHFPCSTSAKHFGAWINIIALTCICVLLTYLTIVFGDSTKVIN